MAPLVTLYPYPQKYLIFLCGDFSLYSVTIPCLLGIFPFRTTRIEEQKGGQSELLVAPMPALNSGNSTPIMLTFASSPQMEKAREMPVDVRPSQGQSWFLPIRLKEAQRETYTKLTCRKTHFLVALGKFNIKIGDKGMDVVVALYLQAEGRCKGQLFRLHSVNVHFLQPRGERKRRLTTSVSPGGPVTSPLEKLD